MKNLAKKIQRFLVLEGGPTAVDCVVVLSLIVIVYLVAIDTICTNDNVTLTSVADQLRP